MPRIHCHGFISNHPDELAGVLSSCAPKDGYGRIDIIYVNLVNVPIEQQDQGKASSTGKRLKVVPS